MASSSLVTFVFNTIFFCTPFTPFKRLALCDLSVLTEIVLLPVCWALYSVQPRSFSPTFSLHAVSPFGLPDITCIQLIIYFFCYWRLFQRCGETSCPLLYWWFKWSTDSTCNRGTNKECLGKRLKKERPTQELLIRAGFAAKASAGRSKML